MGRLLKLVVCVAALTAGGGVALAASGPAPRRGSAMIVCPLEPNSTVATTCCGPPVATVGSAAIVCCATAAQIACPVPLLAGSTPNPSTAGRRVTISGHWSGGTAGQTVVLWRKLPGAKTFSRAGQTTTGSSGQFQFVRSVETNREWYVTVGSDRSGTIDQGVRALVTLTLSGLEAHGRVSPNHAGERVVLEQHTPSGWNVIARPRVTRESTYSARVPGRGEVDFRTVFLGDMRNIRSVSRQFKVTA